MSVSYKDASVPVLGFEMEVLRTYDSYDKRQGDFGVGWTVGIANFRVAANRPLGSAYWTQQQTNCTLLGCFTAFTSTTPHSVTVTYPDGHQEIFDLTPTGGPLAILLGHAKFTPRAGTGTTSKLEVTDTGNNDDAFYIANGTLRKSTNIQELYNPTRFTLTTRAGQVLVLDVASGLVSATDPNGNSLSVDATGIHASNGQSITYTRVAGRITQITKPDNSFVTYTYTPAGDLWTVTYWAAGDNPLQPPPADRIVYKYEYNTNHYLLNAREPGKAPYSVLEYDPEGRLMAMTDRAGKRTAIDNQVAGQQQIITSPSGLTTTIDTFNDRGDLIQEDVIGDGKTITTTSTYNTIGQQLTFTNGRGHTWVKTYDEQTGDLLTYKDFNGNTQRYEYTTKGFIEYEYPPDATPNNNADDIARLHHEYFPNGNPKKVTRVDNSASNFTYYPNGNLNTASDPGQRTLTFGYDAAGRLSSITDPLQHVTGVTMDGMGRVREVVDPLTAHTFRDYDENGNLLSVTNNSGHSRSYTYDSFDREQTMTDALGNTATNTYGGANAAGPLEFRTDRNGDQIHYEYDGDGRLWKKTLPGNDVTTYTYDGFGRLETATNASAAMTFTYDDAGNLESETTIGTASAPRPAVTHTYTYDNSGKPLSVTGPEGTLGYTYYDKHDQLHTLTDYAGDTFVFTYDTLDRLQRIERPNAVTDELTYNPSDNIMSRNASIPGPQGTPTPLSKAEYIYDDAGWRTSMTNMDGTTIYTPDDNGQLLAADHPEASGIADEAYSYNLLGNRTSPGGPMTYNANDQLTQDATYDYSYDNEGNMLSRTLRSDPSQVTSYAWNAEHQLLEVGLPDGSHVTFRYDALGNRIEIAHGSDIRRYVYDRGVISAEYDGNNDLVVTYVHTPQTFAFANPGAVADIANIMAEVKPSQILEMERNDHRYFHLADALGSTTALTDEGATVVERNGYEAYGNRTATANQGNPFAFTGVVHDPTTNLYLMPLRAYDAVLGRFLSEDPLPAVNWYPYASNSPVNFADRSGANFTENAILRSMLYQSVGGAAAGAGGGIAGGGRGVAVGALGGAASGAVYGLLPGGLGSAVNALWLYHSALIGTVPVLLLFS